VTQGEDASRIRMHQLPQIFAVARNFAINRPVVKYDLKSLKASLGEDFKDFCAK